MQHGKLLKTISAKNLLAKAMDAFRVPAFAPAVA
jgi:hypothetical protein